MSPMNSEPSKQTGKATLRKRIRRQRSELAPEQRRAWDRQLNGHLLDYVRRKQPRVVAAYLAFDGEPDLFSALEQMAQAGVRLALPVVRDRPGRADICFRQWSPGSELHANRYGIPEPMGTLDVRLDEIDVALIPLVGWDASGSRLGMGASYYDRVFQPLAGQARPLRLGVAYQLQQVERVPTDPWDIRLHGILTEQGCFTFPP